MHQYMHQQGDLAQVETLANELRERLTADELRELVALLTTKN